MVFATIGYRKALQAFEDQTYSASSNAAVLKYFESVLMQTNPVPTLHTPGFLFYISLPVSCSLVVPCTAGPELFLTRTSGETLAAKDFQIKDVAGPRRVQVTILA